MPGTIQTVGDVARRFFAVPSRSDEVELLDDTGHDQAELATNFRDIQRVNQLLGGTAIVLRHLTGLVDAVPTTRPVTVLDLGTGSADIPLAISRWANQHDQAISIVASDASEPILDLARRQVEAHPDITIAQYDARAVPLPDKQFEIVLCSLSLHHFSPDDAVRVLREMDRLARTGFILNDLRRGRLGYVAAWIASRLTTRNRLTRNDAPLSVMRAYTPSELERLLHRAGITDAVISTHPWFRMAAVRIRAGHDD
ncbi:MAG: methyltransferase domain-containing protein [Chloroflexota bacterium]|nr:methyltransferase domain-containing protein [Chloroflexota bacterium]